MYRIFRLGQSRLSSSPFIGITYFSLEIYPIYYPSFYRSDSSHFIGDISICTIADCHT